MVWQETYAKLMVLRVCEPGPDRPQAVDCENTELLARSYKTKLLASKLPKINVAMTLSREETQSSREAIRAGKWFEGEKDTRKEFLFLFGK